jgi:hypothetical protein
MKDVAIHLLRQDIQTILSNIKSHCKSFIIIALTNFQNILVQHLFTD